ncbi:MAG: protein translocase subunit SecD [Rhodothermaceae bacterium]|nr:protein translocase subunit SecD [Rhodothermaceae bacterium]MXZ57055.1 protein translocase subunit SecD [Rhodothermaceae bacterium]MYB90787.1 protein translocase subunit SecD [Rhodothermaceae bacterium]MYD68654.1 protein translocase subunit SecD [Rhodothermaceae bacterium]MYG45245.1 protein translocase subunit SecD [Rhodothermaceae bacterium]
MQGNGFKVGAVVFFLALSAWYLFPSFQGLSLNNRLEGMALEERVEYERDNYSRIESIKEKSLNLGLDLQGGMHVTMEVGLRELLVQLAGERRDDMFDQVLVAADVRTEAEGISLIDAFVEEFESRDPDASLSRYFRSEEITRRSSNAEVTDYLNTQALEAIERAMQVIRNRVDRYGVTEPSIQTQGSRRIVVELPGIDDPERVRRLLKGTARLEFRLMADPGELNSSLQRIISYYEVDVAAEADSVETPAEEDTSEEADTSFDVSQLLAETEGLDDVGNPLLDVLIPAGQGSVVFGEVSVQDTAIFNSLMADPEVQAMLPRDIELLYDANPSGTGGAEYYPVLAVNVNAELTGDVITDARADFDQTTNQPLVDMEMNSEGARVWSRITGANVGKNVAIVLDRVVYSYPTVIGQISGGRSQITGLASQEESDDIVTVLKSGALPAPVEIVEERTVGPSLGIVARRSGFTSLLFGLSIVALFMIIYYRGGGMVADLALIINIIFILGILAGFNATLTLPGIAGIVLTIGMAVDANVLIFERVREEQSTGKTLKASIDGGYGKALSAIVDANITTFFVGIILYSFGVGPIQGFAVTLMAGILASLFSAIVFTRIIFDYVVIGRRGVVGFG